MYVYNRNWLMIVCTSSVHPAVGDLPTDHQPNQSVNMNFDFKCLHVLLIQTNEFLEFPHEVEISAFTIPYMRKCPIFFSFEAAKLKKKWMVKYLQ